MKKILVIDGNSIINRAYYGMRPLTTKSGKPTHAVYGMINIIMRQVSALKPDYTAVAFDLKAPTFRHKMYDGYKAGRHPTPEDLLVQFPDAKECLGLMGIHVLELPGYEADDIQGTVAKMAHTETDTHGYILSGDRDLLQLIDDKVTVLLATNTETKTMDADAFRQEYGIDPDRFVDMKALMGDSSDNIPGVAGVGKKTAQTLIENFASLDGIYENIEDKRISKGVREKLIRDKENAYMSRELAKICTDAPLGLSLQELKNKPRDTAGLYRKFSELELNSLIVKFGLTAADTATDEVKSDSSPALENTEKLYTAQDAQKILSIAEKTVCAEILNGIVYISAGEQHFSYNGSLEDIKEFFKNKRIICHDGKWLWHRLDEAGCDLKESLFLDLSLYAYVLNPGGGSPTAQSLATEFIGITPEPNAPCSCYFEKIEAEMRKKVCEGELEFILDEIEIPLLNLLCEMEKVGFMIDRQGVNEYGEALDELAEELLSRATM